MSYSSDAIINNNAVGHMESADIEEAHDNSNIQITSFLPAMIGVAAAVPLILTGDVIFSGIGVALLVAGVGSGLYIKKVCSAFKQHTVEKRQHESQNYNEYIDSLENLCKQMLPILSRQIDSSNMQSEEGINELSNEFPELR